VNGGQISLTGNKQTIVDSIRAPPTFLIDQSPNLRFNKSGELVEAPGVKNPKYLPEQLAKVYTATDPNVISAMYHMAYRYGEDKFLEYIQVPSDFIIISIASPGSNLFISDTGINNYQAAIQAELLRDPYGFYKRFRGYDSYPMEAPPVSPQIFQQYLDLVPSEDITPQDVFNQTVQHARFIQQFARKPIVNQCFEPVFNARAVKQAQIELQMYMPGDYMLQRMMLRTPRDDIVWPTSMGTYVWTPDGKQKIDDPELKTMTPATLSDYLGIIRGRLPPTNTPKVKVLVLFGCASIERPMFETEEAFYEFSHRRAIVHNTFFVDNLGRGADSLDIEKKQFSNTVAPYIRGELPNLPRFTSCAEIIKTYTSYTRSFLRNDEFWQNVSVVDPAKMDLDGGKRVKTYRKKLKKIRLTRRR
jgi:hypothetical protein